MGTVLETGIAIALTGTAAYIAYKAGWLPGTNKKEEEANLAQQQAQQAVAGLQLTQSPPCDSFVRTGVA